MSIEQVGVAARRRSASRATKTSNFGVGRRESHDASGFYGRFEAPVLERNWRGYRDRRVAVIGIDIQDTDEAARKFIDTFSLTFPNARDVGGRVSVDYGVYGVPETFFIDRAGRIRAKHVGAVTDAVFREHVDRLLAEEA